jgi:hypothetical protein
MANEKKSAEVVKRQVAQLREQIEVLKEQAREQGQAFSALDDDQLTKKELGETSNSPFIYAQSWTSGTSPGSTASYTVYVRNPDPVGYYPVYATIFFGLGNFFGVDQAWNGRDQRWPQSSSERTLLPANSDRSFSFTYTVPTGLPSGTYNGNSVVWRGDWHDVGVAYDRGSFDLKLP